MPRPVRKGFAFPSRKDKIAARLSLAAMIGLTSIGKAEPYRTGGGKAAD